jgi:hypothetical protein
MGHKGGITDLYTRADLVRMAKAAEEIGTPWEPQPIDEILQKP